MSNHPIVNHLYTDGYIRLSHPFILGVVKKTGSIYALDMIWSAKTGPGFCALSCL